MVAIDFPSADEITGAAIELIGTASSSVGVDSVLVGIKDVISNKWWNGNDWGDWILNPATISPTAGTEVNWLYGFYPNNTGGSGKYRLHVRAKDITGILSDSVQIPFESLHN